MSNLRTLCERCNLGKRDKLESGTTVSPDQFVELLKKSDLATNVKTSSPGNSKKHNPASQKTDVLEILKQEGVSYIDKRAAGGALWVIGGHELDEIMAQIKRKGYAFVFSEKGGKVTKGQSAWWYKGD